MPSNKVFIVSLLSNLYAVLINLLQAIVSLGVLNADDISDIFITDDPDAAVSYLIDKLTFSPPTTRLPNSRSMNSVLIHPTEGGSSNPSSSNSST